MESVPNVRLRNVANMLSRIKREDDPRLFDHFTGLLNDSPHMPKVNLIRKLEVICQCVEAVKSDLKTLKNEPMDDVKSLFSGQPIKYPAVDETNETGPFAQDEIESCMIPSDYRNPDQIKLDIGNMSKGLPVEIRVESYATEVHYDKYGNTSSHLQNILNTQMFALKEYSKKTFEIQNLTRRYQALAYGKLCQESKFECLEDCFTELFRSLVEIQKLMEPKEDALNVLRDVLERAWNLEGGPDRTIKTGQKKSFDLKLRPLIDINKVSASGFNFKGDPVLTVTTEHGSSVQCKVDFESKVEGHTLTVTAITFNDLERKFKRGLSQYQHFYVLKLTQNVSFLDMDIALEFQTFPFTIHCTANQLHSAMGAVSWHIFSQDDQNSGVHLKTEMPIQAVLQMFNLQAKNISESGVKDLDKIELTELQRLLTKQTSNSNSVTMASIFQTKMKHPRIAVNTMDFPFYTWFVACLNTLVRFANEWKQGLMVGFYSKQDAKKILKNIAKRKKGDTLIRLSQTTIHKPQSYQPMAELAIHICLNPTEDHIDGCKVDEQGNFSSRLKQFVSSSNRILITRLWPKGVNFSDISDKQSTANQIDMNRYDKPYIQHDPTTEPISKLETATSEPSDSPISVQSAMTPAPTPVAVQEEEVEEDEPEPKKFHAEYSHTYACLRKDPDPFMTSVAGEPLDDQIDFVSDYFNA